MKNLPFHKRLRFALMGLQTAWISEASFRFQTVGALFAVGAFALLQASPLWWAILILTICAVLSTELLNTALEHLLDRIHPERHPAIKAAKDCAAGAVLVFSLGSVCIFLLFLSQRLSVD